MAALLCKCVLKNTPCKLLLDAAAIRGHTAASSSGWFSGSLRLYWEIFVLLLVEG
jgi:hypothetical protein